jgi:hypothetical protein
MRERGSTECRDLDSAQRIEKTGFKYTPVLHRALMRLFTGFTDEVLYRVRRTEKIRAAPTNCTKMVHSDACSRSARAKAFS